MLQNSRSHRFAAHHRCAMCCVIASRAALLSAHSHTATLPTGRWQAWHRAHDPCRSPVHWDQQCPPSSPSPTTRWDPMCAHSAYTQLARYLTNQLFLGQPPVILDHKIGRRRLLEVSWRELARPRTVPMNQPVAWEACVPQPSMCSVAGDVDRVS